MNKLLMIAGGVTAVYNFVTLIVSQIVEWINTMLNRAVLVRRAQADRSGAINWFEAGFGSF